ncbi:short-chain dehydrogenase/reductase SDR [Sphingomonas sp. MM-1]|uniref:SDR family NAD(P)-dependent oxidoreductase n=1 Tax=Sphingomonas sp. MM-1 TaxID=745310 RepID=UPI0002C1199D|nr:SDR family oxidoreductase [Sphingomonas sp. MM-1]AGH51358.1 short-chain dehydrogenase/reductase SDR [Sphingomonas sp. MM-1]
MSDGELKGQVAIVTGGGQGVGRGIALSLARRGATVALGGRTLDKLEAVAAECGNGARAFAIDIKDGAAIKDMVAKVVDAFGGVDILVNNAQEVPLGTLLDVTDEQFQAGFDSGPLATMRFMKACQPLMAKRGGGVIINLTSSATVRWDMAGYGTYAAIKQGIRSLSRAAAAEWGPDGIRVLTIAPHADSPALKGWIESRPEEAAAFFKTIPLRRIGRCEEDIGEAVAALCGPSFRYLTGATIPLDGGQANFD